VEGEERGEGRRSDFVKFFRKIYGFQKKKFSRTSLAVVRFLKSG
jgi:hypothetical protein